MNTIGLFNQPQGNVADKTACRVVAVAASSVAALAFDAAAHNAAAHQANAVAASAYNPSGLGWSQQSLLMPRFGYLRRG